MIIGQDKFLEKIYYRLKADNSFCLVGSQGIGKSEILKWSYDNYYQNRKIMLSCSDTKGHWITRICYEVGIDPRKRKIAELEQEILNYKEQIYLFIDDIEKAKPAQLKLVKQLQTINYYAGYTKKETIQHLLWGVKQITVPVVDKKSAKIIAKTEAKRLKRAINESDIISHSAGIPGKILAYVRGEPIRDNKKEKSEEINLLPALIAIFVCFLVVARYYGRAVHETDLYLIGGAGMGLAIIVRLFGRL